MPFNNEDKAFIKNVYQSKNATFRGYYTDKIFEDKLQKEKMGVLLKRFGKQKAPTKSTSLTDCRIHTIKRT